MPAPDRSNCSSPLLQIDLFGGATLRIDEQRITDLPTRKAEALLIYLACHPQPHQRETLADLLWDDLPADRAATNLRLALNHLRKRFAPFLDVTRQTIALRQDATCMLDVQEFAHLVRGAPDQIETLVEALNLYHGDFLQGFHLRDARSFSEWQASQADHWQQQARTHMRTLVDAYTAHSNYTEAIRWASRLLASDQFDEVSHRQLMLLLARSGQRAAAIRQYRVCQQIMQQELGIDPEPETEALYERICRLPTQRPHNLPMSTRSLLGRAAELARLYAWLANPAARLMSIVGAGGSGKTQIALTVGGRVVTEYFGPCSNGVFYIPLMTIAQSAALLSDVDVLIAIAEQLQLRLAGNHSVLDQIIQQSRDKELLLIVDNGELLSQSARLALGALIQHIPGLRLLVPSRERLKLRDEHVLDLDGLSYPALPSHKVTAQQQQRWCANLLDFASVQLLLECVGQVQGPAPITNYPIQDQVAIAGICSMVHGLPLAIELVAPWMRVRSPSEILHELKQTLDLLIVDMPDMPERHRSVRAVFEYSWQLISDQERGTLTRLSIFPASFTFAAAETIAAATLQHLAALRDKSLLQRVVLNSETRYALHPLLRALAYEKLQADGEIATQLRATHAGYFAKVAAPFEAQLWSAQGPTMLQTLECEMDNLRAGWQWATEMCDLEALGQYSIPLHDFCAIRGWELEGRHLFRGAVGVVRAWHADEYTPEHQLIAAARVLSCHAQLEYTLGAFDIAEEALQHSRRLLSLQAIEDAPELMFIYKQLGLITQWRGAYADATAYLRLALDMAEECGDTHKCADTLLALGSVAYAQGEWSDAKQMLQRCHDIYRAESYYWGMVHTFRFLGMIAVAQGEPQAAHTFYQESVALAQQIEGQIGEALVYDQLGLLYLAEDQLEQSRAALQQALTMFQELGVDIGIARTLCHLGRTAMAQNTEQSAQHYYLQALQMAQRIAAPALLIESLAGMLQFRLHTHRDDWEEPTPKQLLQWLWHHPACPADTKAYIASLLEDSELIAAQPMHPWPLDRILAAVTTWLTAAFPLQPMTHPSSILT